MTPPGSAVHALGVGLHHQERGFLLSCPPSHKENLYKPARSSNPCVSFPCSQRRLVIERNCVMVSMFGMLGSRLRAGWNNPILRHNAVVLLGGKLLGLMIVVGLILWSLPAHALAQASGVADATSQINAINTVWVLVAAFLVFGMQVGFQMLETGFARSRETVNILVEGIVDTCICGVLFWAFGFAFMFEPGTPLIGTTGFFLQGLSDTYGTTGVPLLAFWVFQFAFADTASTITSGAMVGRCDFIGDILYSIVVTGFIYPIIGHWVW
ncbi:MAG: hypothetical protein WCG77_11920, partial [Actinomycetes bacterium]